MSAKFFLSTDTGVPTLTNGAGSLIAVLDACLVSGYNTQTASSLTQAAGVATVGLNSGHGFKPDQKVLVAGANEAGYNGEQTITATTATSISYAVPASTAATATGTVNVKVAPLGWTKAFSGSNKAAYTPSSPQSLGFYLRVDDTGTSARVRGYEGMTDVDTGVGPFPNDAQINGGGYWAKQYSSNVTTWALFGDERLFYLVVSPLAISNADYGPLFGFGDINAQSSSDAYACMIAAGDHDWTTDSSPVSGDMSLTSSSLNVFFPRGYAQIGSPKKAWLASFGIPLDSGVFSGAGAPAGGGVALVFPNTPDNGVFVNAPYLGHDGAIRGQLPGLYHTCQNWKSNYNNGDKITGTDALLGKKLMAVRTGAPANFNYVGMVGLDITGPWR